MAFLELYDLMPMMECLKLPAQVEVNACFEGLSPWLQVTKGGGLALSQGAILTGLVWGAIVASLIDGNFKVAGGFTLAGAAMSSVGIVHGAALHWPSLGGPTGGYLVAAAFFLIYPLVLGGRAAETGDPAPEEAAPQGRGAPAE